MNYSKKIAFSWFVITLLTCVIISLLTDEPEPKTEEPTTVEVTTEATTTEEVTTTEVTYSYLGEFYLTAYCSCEQCCGMWALNRSNGIVYGASGNVLKDNYSIAVDPSIIPYGTEVVINGVTYRADDCGGSIKGNRIDVYFDTHDEALRFGVGYYDVFMEVK